MLEKLSYIHPLRKEWEAMCHIVSRSSFEEHQVTSSNILVSWPDVLYISVVTSRTYYLVEDSNMTTFGTVVDHCANTEKQLRSTETFHSKPSRPSMDDSYQQASWRGHGIMFGGVVRYKVEFTYLLRKQTRYYQMCSLMLIIFSVC